jgi:signal peptidase I
MTKGIEKLIIIFSAWLIVILIAGCSREESVINDNSTLEQLPEIHITDGMLTVDYYSDNMDRGRHDLVYPHYGSLIIDPKFYIEANIARGDIIYYSTPEFEYDLNPKLNPSEKSIARVIALSGETVAIRKGQIYINNKKLNTFYGKYLKGGLKKVGIHFRWNGKIFVY